MSIDVSRGSKPLPNVVKADGEEPIFHEGDSVKVSLRFPVGYYRVPIFTV